MDISRLMVVTEKGDMSVMYMGELVISLMCEVSHGEIAWIVTDNVVDYQEEFETPDIAREIFWTRFKWYLTGKVRFEYDVCEDGKGFLYKVN